jgi:Fe-S cluster assembly iron-binding protein IscA
MLEITQQATSHLIRVRAEQGYSADAGARFVRGTTGVGLTFATQPEQGDVVLAGPDLHVYVAEEVANVLDNAVIDETSEDGGSRLILRPQGAERATSQLPRR